MASSIEIDVSANIAKFKTAMDRASMEGGKLSKNLTKSFRSIKSGMNAVSKLFGVAGGSLGFMTKRSIDAADKIQKLSIRLGASTEALSEYKHVAELSGVTFETLTMGWQRMTRRVAEAAQGTGEAKGALVELGLSAKALNQLAPEKQFEALADAIMKVKNPADQVRLSMKLFDSEGVSLIQTMQGGSKAMKATRQEAVELGKSLSRDQVDGAAAAKDAFTKLSASISGGFTQSLLNYTDDIVSLADWFRESIPKAIGATVSAFNTIKPAILPMLAAFAAIKAYIVIWPALSAAILAARAGMVAFSFQTIAATAASGAMTGSLTLLRGAMALLGGPAGVIAIAVGALAIFISQSRKAKNENLDFIRSINTTKALSLSEALTKTNGIIDDFESRLVDARAALDKAIGNGGGGITGINSAALAAKQSISELEAELSEAKGASQELSKQIEEQADITEQLEGATTSTGAAINVFGENADQAAKELKALNDVFASGDAHIKAYRAETLRAAEATGTTLFRSQKQLSQAIAESKEFTKNYEKALRAAKDALVKDGLIEGTEKFRIELGKLGFDTEQVTGSMNKSWERFADGAFDSFKTFTKSAFTDFKSFGDSIKDLAKDIVADLIATFASNKLKKVLSDLFGSVTGGSSGGGAGGSGAGGLGGASSVLGSIGTLSSSGAGFLGSVGASIGAGFSAIGSSIAAAGSAISGATTAVLAALGPVGAAVAAVAVVAALVGGGARTPQELGEDQLRAVDEATQAGRNTQVQLGQAAGTSLSFLGGFDENSTFFGVDLLKDQLQEVGNVLQERFGFNQALALKDGVIRLEDFTRNFSENNDEIVAEVKAAIVEVELSITDLERTTIASLGSTLVEVDRLFDSTAGSGETTAERLADAYATAFDTTTEAGNEWLASTQLSADRIAEIFNESSAEVTEALFGVSESGAEAFQQLADGARLQAGAINQSFSDIRLPTITQSQVSAANSQAGQSQGQGLGDVTSTLNRLASGIEAQQEELKLKRLRPAGGR